MQPSRKDDYREKFIVFLRDLQLAMMSIKNNMYEAFALRVVACTENRGIWFRRNIKKSEPKRNIKYETLEIHVPCPTKVFGKPFYVANIRDFLPQEDKQLLEGFCDKWERFNGGTIKVPELQVSCFDIKLYSTGISLLDDAAEDAVFRGIERIKKFHDEKQIRVEIEVSRKNFASVLGWNETKFLSCLSADGKSIQISGEGVLVLIDYKISELGYILLYPSEETLNAARDILQDEFTKPLPFRCEEGAGEKS